MMVWVTVYQADFLPKMGERGGEVPSCRCLTNATFLVCDSDYFHSVLPFFLTLGEYLFLPLHHAVIASDECCELQQDMCVVQL